MSSPGGTPPSDHSPEPQPDPWSWQGPGQPQSADAPATPDPGADAAMPEQPTPTAAPAAEPDAPDDLDKTTPRSWTVAPAEAGAFDPSGAQQPPAPSPGDAAAPTADPDAPTLLRPAVQPWESPGPAEQHTEQRPAADVWGTPQTTNPYSAPADPYAANPYPTPGYAATEMAPGGTPYPPDPYAAEPYAAAGGYDPVPAYQQPYGFDAAPPAVPAGYGFDQPPQPPTTPQYGYPSGPPPKKSKKKPVLLAALLAVVVALGAGGYFVFLAKDKPTLTFGGKKIANADELLATGQKQVEKQVSSRHGVKAGSTKCYFALPKEPAKGDKKTDISNELLCGPVLFVDGDAAQPYLAFTINQTGSQSGKVVLGLSETPESPNPAAVPSSVKLQRPDGTTPPSGSDGLKPPAPPKAEADTLTTAELGPSKLDDAPKGAVMIGDTFGVQLVTVGIVDRYGSGDSARATPDGAKLVAFTFTLTDGATKKEATDIAIGIQIGNDEPRTVPGRTPAVIVAVPDGQQATLLMRDSGVQQSLSLPDGKPGADNIQINVREHRTSSVAKTGTYRIKLSYEGDTGTQPVKYTLKGASLYSAVGNAKITSPRNALMTVGLTYNYTGQPTGNFTYSGSYGPFVYYPEQLAVIVNGKTYKAKDADPSSDLQLYFEVPASVTSATLVIGGTHNQSNGISLTVSPAIRIPITFPAG